MSQLDRTARHVVTAPKKFFSDSRFHPRPRHTPEPAPNERVSREAAADLGQHAPGFARRVHDSLTFSELDRDRRQPQQGSKAMNEFRDVSMAEMDQVVGGAWYHSVGRFLEKVAVAVVTALVVKKVQ
jgi:hypothetical protein